MTTPSHDDDHLGAVERAAALAAMALAVAALVVGIVSLAGDLGRAIFAPIALVIAACSIWVAATRTHTIRIVAGGVAVVSLGFVIVGVVTAEANGLGLVVVLLLVAASGVLARRALRRDPATLKAMAPPGDPVGPARRGVLIMNLKSGGGKAEKYSLEDECRARGIEPVVLHMDDDLADLAQQAIDGGADVIGMAGGDGSQACVASVAKDAGIPIVCIPAGTRNHFALDLGLDRDDVVGALDAFGDAVERSIDLAEVNERVFVNNVSLGVYAKIVQSPDYRDAKGATTATMLPELLGPDAEPFGLRFTGPDGAENETAQIIQVSNNPYVLTSLAGFGSRVRLDTGELGIAAAEVHGAADIAAFVAAESAGQLERFRGWTEWAAPTFTVAADDRVEAGVDGEAMLLDPPLEFRILPAAVRVRIPLHAPGFSPAALQPPSPWWTLTALLRAARGLPTPIDDERR